MKKSALIKRRASFRPMLEALEDRSVPTTTPISSSVESFAIGHSELGFAGNYFGDWWYDLISDDKRDVQVDEQQGSVNSLSAQSSINFGPFESSVTLFYAGEQHASMQAAAQSTVSAEFSPTNGAVAMGTDFYSRGLYDIGDNAWAHFRASMFTSVLFTYTFATDYSGTIYVDADPGVIEGGAGDFASVRHRVYVGGDGDFTAGTHTLTIGVETDYYSSGFYNQSGFQHHVEAWWNPGDFVQWQILGELPPPNIFPISNANGPYQVPEGGSIVLDGLTGSSDADGTLDSYEWDFNYDGLTFNVDATGYAPNFSAAQLDGNSSRTVALRVIDNLGGTAISTASLTVTNQAPTAHVTGSTDGVADQSRTFVFSGSDPGVADTTTGFIYQIAWGDGQTQTVLRSAGNDSGVSLEHAFANTGVYVVQVTATDKDGGTSVVASHNITIFNRAPFVTDFSKIGAEDNALTFSSSDFISNYSDADADLLTAVRIGSLPGGGVLRLNGTAVTAGQVITASELHRLTFVPNLNFNGTVTFQYNATDGDQYANNSATITLDIRSANQQNETMSQLIQALVSSGALTSGQGEALTINLRDNNGDAGKVQAFLNQVAALLNGGILNQAQANALLGLGNNLLHSVSHR